MTSIQPSLFDDEVAESPQIDGLVHVSDFITEAEESALLNIIDQQEWISN